MVKLVEKSALMKKKQDGAQMITGLHGTHAVKLHLVHTHQMELPSPIQILQPIKVIMVIPIFTLLLKIQIYT